MKINNKYILAGALSLGMAGVSNAATVYMTGSTAFRGNTFTALSTAGVVFTAVPQITTWGATSQSGATYMAFSGTAESDGVTPLIVQCDWSGSEAGVKDVSPQGVAEPFSTDALDGGTHSGNPTGTANHTVDIAMADNDPKYARVYADNPTPPAVLANKTEVGVVTFKWIRNNGLWTGSSVSSSAIRQALNAPGVFRSVFDGNSAHTNDYVYVSGRDNSSGTRVNAYGITGFGIFNTPNQIELDGSGNMMVLDAGGDYIGDFGFSSGGTLAKSLGSSTTASTDQVEGPTGFSVIAYLGFNDSATALGLTPNPAVELAFDGVTFSLSAITEGAYNFWGNEYICENNAAIAPATSVYSELAATTGINATIPAGAANTSPNGIRLTDMHTLRSGPLGDPVHK